MYARERFEKKESVVFVAEKQNVLLGFTQLYPIFSSVWLKRSWLLNDLYVHATARSQGIASQLLEAAKNHGKQTEAIWLLLQTQPDNFSAQSLYEKNGWKKLSDYLYELPLSS